MTDSREKYSETESLKKLEKQFRDGLRMGQIGSLKDYLSSLGRQHTTAELAALVEIELEYLRSQGVQVVVREFYQWLPDLLRIEIEQTVTNLIHDTTAAATEYVDVSHLPAKRRIMAAGDRIDDFELLAELGEGSFATVFLARQISMQRLVALKVSSDHGMEAQTLAQLDHPHIVRVFDQRRAPDHNLQLLYMQFLEGGTLLDVIKRIASEPQSALNGNLFVQCVDQVIVDRGYSPQFDSPLRQSYCQYDWEQTVCQIGYHLARALEYAHQKGVLHRDIKPANVLIGSDYTVKLADFNISSADTVVGEFKFGGSLAYMSPEQIMAFNPNHEFTADRLDQRCDIYSLGVVMFQLLRRDIPFSAFSRSRSATGLDVMVAERQQGIGRIEEELREHSPLIRRALIRCLQPRLEDRPENARDLANQLRVGLDRQAEQFLFPSQHKWLIPMQKHFLLVCIAVNLVFNILAAWFVYNFNLLGSVPDIAKDVFWNVQAGVNGVAFPLAITMFVVLTWSVPKSLGLCLAGRHAEVSDLRLAINRNLQAGHIQAVICGTLWLIAGFLYPVLLTLFGVKLLRSDWIDFIASHSLSGIAITALTFFATTYLSLRIWLPVLIQNSFAGVVVESVVQSLNSLVRKIPIYQLLAVSVPLLAMALLVIFGDSMQHSKFALTVISLFGLLTIPILIYGGNKIKEIGQKLLVVFGID